MDRNTILAFVLMGAIFVVWLFMNTPEEPPRLPKNNKQVTQVDTNANKPKVDSSTIAKPTTNNNNIAQADTLKIFKENPAPQKDIYVKTDVAVYIFSSKGGNLKAVYLKNYKTFYAKEDNDFYKDHVQLLKPGGDFDFEFVTVEGKKVFTNKYNFENDQPAEINISGNKSQTITFTLPYQNNGYIKKVFTVTGDQYEVGASVEFKGFNNKISNNDLDLVWGSGINFVEENTVDEANYSKSSLLQGGEHAILDATDINKPQSRDYNGAVDWVSIRNKYFTSIIAPDKPQDITTTTLMGNRVNMPNNGIYENYSARLTLNYSNEETYKKNFHIYLGPVDYDILKAYHKNYEIIIDYGSFFGLKFIVRPIAEYVFNPLFKFLHRFISNFGLVIIVFSLIIKILLHPLTKKSYASMKKMQLLQPKMTELKEKYKDDPQKMNKETMKLYSTYGVNPAGGCLPLVLQMPIFIALWGLFQAAIELRHQPFVWWIKDLSRPDVIVNLPFSIPFFGIQQLSGLALLMGITTFVQQKMTVKDPKQQAMIYVMPVFLTILFMSFPSGLNLYYFMFNILSIAQQEYYNRTHNDMVLVPVKQSTKKKSGFMERLMDTAEQNAKTKQSNKKRK